MLFMGFFVYYFISVCIFLLFLMKNRSQNKNNYNYFSINRVQGKFKSS